MCIFYYSTRLSKNLSVYICAMTEPDAMDKFMCLLSDLTDHPESVVVEKVDKII